MCGGHRWPWATGRLSAGFVLDLRHDPTVGKALMFFHGSDYPENDARGGFDTFASVRALSPTLFWFALALSACFTPHSSACFTLEVLFTVRSKASRELESTAEQSR